MAPAKRYARIFGLAFAVTLVAGVAVTFAWNVLLNPEGVVDWGASFRLALILAFALSAVEGRKGV